MFSLVLGKLLFAPVTGIIPGYAPRLRKHNVCLPYTFTLALCFHINSNEDSASLRPRRRQDCGIIQKQVFIAYILDTMSNGQVLSIMAMLRKGNVNRLGLEMRAEPVESKYQRLLNSHGSQTLQVFSRLLLVFGRLLLVFRGFTANKFVSCSFKKGTMLATVTLFPPQNFCRSTRTC